MSDILTGDERELIELVEFLLSHEDSIGTINNEEVRGLLRIIDRLAPLAPLDAPTAATDAAEAEYSGYQRKGKNADPSALKTGDNFSLWVNQGWRDARVLLCRANGHKLIEYSMPKGSTSLQIHTDEQCKRVSYFTLEWSWLQDLLYEGTEWEGNPQGGRDPGSVLNQYSERATQRFGLKAGSVIMATSVDTDKRDLVTITQDMIDHREIPYCDIAVWSGDAPQPPGPPEQPAPAATATEPTPAPTAPDAPFRVGDHVVWRHWPQPYGHQGIVKEIYTFDIAAECDGKIYLKEPDQLVLLYDAPQPAPAAPAPEPTPNTTAEFKEAWREAMTGDTASWDDFKAELDKPEPTAAPLPAARLPPLTLPQSKALQKAKKLDKEKRPIRSRVHAPLTVLRNLEKKGYLEAFDSEPQPSNREVDVLFSLTAAAKGGK